jgi:hypothetical protein
VDFVKEKPSTPTDTLLVLSSNDVTGRAGTFVYNLNIAQPSISNSLGESGDRSGSTDFPDQLKAAKPAA